MRNVECGNMRQRSHSTAMRLGLGAALFVVASGASCTRSMRNPFATYGPPAPEVLIGEASLNQILEAVNQNSRKITSYQTNNASISVPGSPGVPSLRGNLAAQRPGRVRLQASTALTGPEVDLGSNDEMFWVWFRRNEPPTMYVSRHDRYAGSAAQQYLPVEPQWLLDALGMAEFKATDFHEGPVVRDKNTVEIKSVVQSPGGEVVKRTVVDSRRAWVLEQHVYSRTGTLLASAVAKSHKYYPEAGVSLPQEIEIQIPSTGLQLSIDVGTVTINGPMDNQQLWSVPTMAGVPTLDLGATPPSSPGGGPPPLGDQMTRADWYGPAPAGGAPAIIGAAPPAPTTGAPLGGSLGAVSPTPGGVAPQFVPPGGQPAGPVDPFVTATTPVAPYQAPPGTQRLPIGGVAAQPVFER